MKILRRAGVFFDKAVDYMLLASAIIIIIDALAVSQDVLVRKIFNFTWSPQYELITYTLVWITFLGTTAIMRSHGHVKMDSLTGRLSPKKQALLNFITSSLVVVLLVGAVFYTSRLTIYDYQNNFILATILNPPKWPIEIIIPIGFFMLLIQVIRNAAGFYSTFRRLGTENPTESE